MWADVEACFAAHRARLESRGIALAAELEPTPGLLCAYSAGVVRLALPAMDDAGGRLRATMIAAMMGETVGEVAWLFEALRPRLIAHEIGHALRDEAGLLGGDVRVEEQVADRLGVLLGHESVPRADRRRAHEMLRGVCARIGGLAEAAALHRRAGEAADRLGLSASEEAIAAARTKLQRDYYRDVSAYLRITAAWALIDLTLPMEDDLDDFRRDHLSA